MNSADWDSIADFLEHLDGLPVMAWAADDTGQRIGFNHTWREHTGLSGRDCAGTGWLAAIHPDDHAVASGSAGGDYRLIDAAGRHGWVRECRGAWAGGVFGLLVPVDDLRVGGAPPLDESRDEVPAALARVAQDGTLLAANARFAQVVGHEHAALAHMRLRDLSHPEDEARVNQGLASLLDGRLTLFTLEKRCIRADGSSTWVDMRVTLRRDATGAADCFLVGLEPIDAWVADRQALADAEARYGSILDTALSAMVVIDEHGVVERFNPAAERLFGYEEREVVGRNVSMLMGPPEAEEHDAYLAHHLRTGLRRIIGVGREVTARHRDGRRILAHLAVTELHSPGRLRFLGTMHDLSERERIALELQAANDKLAASLAELEQRSLASQRLKEAADLLQTCHSAAEAFQVVSQVAAPLLDGLPGALYSIDPANPAVLELSVTWGDYQAQQPVFAPDDCWALRRGQPHASPDPDQGLRCRHLNTDAGPCRCVPLVAGGETMGVLHLDEREAPEARLRSADRERWVLTVAEQLSLSLANLRLQETLRRQATRDALTGLYNRRYLQEALEREVRRAVRSGRPLAVVMVDLDHFKDVNDRYGHDAGDEMLRQVARRLASHFRSEDLLCRYGGEEFLAILPETPLSRALERAEAMRAGIEGVVIAHGERDLPTVTLSAGVAVTPGHGDTAEALLHAADAALYRAKNAGRNRVEAAPGGA